MNRQFDKTKFQVLAGVLSESRLYEQGEDPHVDYSNLHHHYAERDFERAQQPGEEFSKIVVHLKGLGDETKDIIHDTLSEYSSDLGIDYDPHNDTIVVGVDNPIPVGEIPGEINHLFNILKTNTGVHNIKITEFD